MIAFARDYLTRAGRTFIDAFIGFAIIIMVPPATQLVSDIATTGGKGEVDIDLNVWRNLLLACVVAGVIAVVSGVKNKAEDATGKDLLIKK